MSEEGICWKSSLISMDFNGRGGATAPKVCYLVFVDSSGPGAQAREPDTPLAGPWQGFPSHFQGNSSVEIPQGSSGWIFLDLCGKLEKSIFGVLGKDLGDPAFSNEGFP